MKRCSCGRLFSTQTTFCSEDGAAVSDAIALYIVPGTVFGDYRVESLLGRGAMGEVWRCIDKNGVTSAVKFMTSDMFDKLGAQQPKVIEQFLREAKAAQKIKHDNIIKIFAVGSLPNGLPYYSMEILQGTPLDKYLRSREALSFSEIEELFEPICQALFLGHSLDIVHRDLKPENIFLVQELGKPSSPKILDFGVAKLMGEGSGLTGSGMGCGSHTARAGWMQV